MTATGTRPAVRSQVEPRIVERRRTVLEAQRRRRSRRLLVAGAVLVTVGAAVAVLWSPLADVDQVVVSGESAMSEQELASATGIAPGDQLVAVDLSAARDRLRDLPLVASATVERRWPDTVRVRVIEHTPALTVRSARQEWVVSRTGAVMSGWAPDEQLPVLELAEDVIGDRPDLPDQLAPVLAAYTRMPDPLRGVLTAGVLGEDGSLSFDLADGGTVQFGPVEGVPAKMVAVQAFLDQVSLECLEVLDVSTPRVTASRAPGCVTPPPTDVDGTVAESPPPESTDDEGTPAAEVDG